MAFNGICGNIGVSIASGCTAVIAACSAGAWRSSFRPFLILSGIAYLAFVPDDGRKRVVQAPDQDVALSCALTIAVVALFLRSRSGSGSFSTRITIMLPKLVEQRMTSAFR